MAIATGNNCVVKLTDNADSEKTLTTFVTNVQIDLKGHGLVDVTAMTDSGHTWASDELEDGGFVVDFLYDHASGTVWDTLCDATAGLRTATAAKAFELGPQGSTGGYPKITGTCWLDAVSIPVAIGDMMRMSATFKIDGAATVGVYS